MIEKVELERIKQAQLASWSANRGVLIPKAMPAKPLRSKRLNLLAKIKNKLKK